MNEGIKITEEMAQKIIDAEPIEIKETGVFSDLKLTKEERIKHAKKIIESRKE